MEMTVYDAFFVTVFKSLRFHISTLETERFQNDAFSKGSLKTVPKMESSEKASFWNAPFLVWTVKTEAF